MYKNIEIREAMKKHRVFSYELAAALGIADSTMSRKMRKEFDENEKKKILSVIERIAKGEIHV